MPVGIVSFILAILFRKQPGHRLWLLIIAFICLGSWRTILSLPQIDPGHVTSYNGDEVTLTGLVNQESDVYDCYLGLQVEAEEITTSGSESQPVEGLVRVIAPRYPLIEYGSRVKISGTLEIPGNPAAGSQREYLARKGIFSQINPDSITLLEEGLGNPLRQGILADKSRARETIQQMLLTRKPPC